MQVADIQRRVQNLFGDTSGVQITAANVIDWVNDGQTDICRKAECLESVYLANIVAGQSAYAYPTDFIKEFSLRVNTIKMCRMTQSALDMLYPERDLSPSNALYYYHFNRQFVLYPIPGTSITSGLVVVYVRDALDVAASGDTPEIPTIFHEDLVRYCLWRALEMDEQWTAADRAKQIYNERILETIYDSNDKQSETYPAVQLCAGD